MSDLSNEVLQEKINSLVGQLEGMEEAGDRESEVYKALFDYVEGLKALLTQKVKVQRRREEEVAARARLAETEADLAAKETELAACRDDYDVAEQARRDAEKTRRAAARAAGVSLPPREEEEEEEAREGPREDDWESGGGAGEEKQ